MEISLEEKKALKYFYNLRATIDESNMLFDEEINVKHGKETIKQITIILNLIEKLQKENEKLREIKNCVVPVSVIKKWIKDRKEKIEKMHPASDCVLIDDYETQIDILKKLLEDEIYDGE